MQDLAGPRRYPRVDRRLRGRGQGLPGLSHDGAALLDRQLAIRRRATVVGAALVTSSFVALAVGIVSANLDRTGAADTSGGPSRRQWRTSA